MERYSVTEEDMKRYHILEKVKEVSLSLTRASDKTKKKVYRTRRRMPEAGLLVQMDSSLRRQTDSLKENSFHGITRDIPYP